MGVKLVSVEELAYHLRDYMAEVREGATLHVFQDGKAIATIKPAPQPFKLEEPPPGKGPFDIEITPLSKPLNEDPADVIIAERERERSGAKYK